MSIPKSEPFLQLPLDNWKLFVAAASLLVTLVSTWFYKLRVDAWKEKESTLKEINASKEKEIENLNQELIDSKQASFDADRRVHQLADLFAEFRKDLSPDEALKFKAIVQKLEELTASGKEEVPYRNAALWLRNNKENLLKKSFERALKEHPDLISKKKSDFSNDLRGYFHWLFLSLDRYQHPDAPLKNFVPQPALSIDTPYISALGSLLRQIHDSQMSPMEERYITAMIKELINKIKMEFLEANL